MIPTDLDRTASSLLLFLLDAAVRAGVVAAAIGAAVFLVRSRGAAFRLKAWTIVLVAALALPVLTAIMPAWQWSIPILQARAMGHAAATPESAESTARFSAEAGIGQDASFISAPVVIGFIYIAGVLAMLIHAVLGWISARRIQSAARLIDDACMVAAVGRHAFAAGLSAAPPLMESAGVLVPATMSVRQPMVMLPADWREWPRERLNAALIHEIAHIARRDALTQRLSLLYRAVMWISPLSWWLHRHISSLAEQASDEAALRAGVAPATYAEALLECFVRVQRNGRRPAWQVAMARRDDANAARRMDRILSWKGGEVMRPKLWLSGLALITLPVVGLAASVHLSAVAAESPAPAPVVMGVSVPGIEVASAPVAVAESASTSAAKVVVTPALPEVAMRTSTHTVPATPQTNQQLPRPVVVLPPDDDFGAGTYDEKTPGVSMPQVLREVKPTYVSDAMRAKVQGVVVLDLVIGVDGRVEKARVIRSLDPLWGLDDQALIAAKQWLFLPAKLNGEAVRARVQLELQFRLH